MICAFTAMPQTRADTISSDVQHGAVREGNGMRILFKPLMILIAFLMGFFIGRAYGGELSPQEVVEEWLRCSAAEDWGCVYDLYAPMVTRSATKAEWVTAHAQHAEAHPLKFWGGKVHHVEGNMVSLSFYETIYRRDYEECLKWAEEQGEDPDGPCRQTYGQRAVFQVQGGRIVQFNWYPPCQRSGCLGEVKGEGEPF